MTVMKKSISELAGWIYKKVWRALSIVSWTGWTSGWYFETPGAKSIKVCRLTNKTGHDRNMHMLFLSIYKAVR